MNSKSSTSYKSDFKLNKDIFYLNHAAVSPWPVSTRQAVEKFAQENCDTGSFNYPEWTKNETELRQKLANLINASDLNDIALVKNTSEGLSMVAFGLPWKSGDNVVIPADEFPSNRIVWEALQSKGVEVRQIKLFPDVDPENLIFQACDKHTQLISVSSVNYANGLRLNLEKIGEFCQQKDILFCIDAIQSIGAIKTDVEAIKADFVIADGHKWMLGPEGLALFYSRPEARDKLNLNEFGWHMIQNPYDFEQTEWQAAKSALRFECGSPNMLCAHALLASVNIILSYGMSHIESSVLENSRMMHDIILNSNNLDCVSADSRGQYAGIVSFKHASIPSHVLYEYLMSNNVMCANRASAVRFSPHFYTDEITIEKALLLADNAKTHI